MRRFVLFLTACLAFGAIVASGKERPIHRPATTTAFEVGFIDDPVIPESSGIVASRRFPGVFWTHNDSGNPPLIFAIDRSGKMIGSFPVKRTNRDWEDIAIDDAGRLYIGEIGNNYARHKQLAVYRVDEPDPHKPLAAGQSLDVTATWQLRFPDKPFDCESLFIWKDYGYVVSKLFDGERAELFRFSLEPQKIPAVLEKVCDLPIRFPCTGADISVDGKHLAIITVAGPYLFDLPKPGDVSALNKIDPLSVFYTDIHMEAVCFVDEGLLATTESRTVYLFRWKDFGPRKEEKPDR
ncbi:hypothetical protein BH10PLA1_BH10PLA1_02450 [soil metagenome]